MTRTFRESRGWTQEHLAQVTGLHVRTIQRLEAGTDPSKETQMALASVGITVEGPHVVLDLEEREAAAWPGLTIHVYKDHYRVPCVLSVDSHHRMVSRLGFFLLDLPEDELSDRVECLMPPSNGRSLDALKAEYDLWEGPKFLVDGEPWYSHEHPVEFPYDSVTVHGSCKAIDKYRDQIPKHWSIIRPVEPQGAST